MEQLDFLEQIDQPPLICPVCNKEFEENNPESIKIYCSRKCYSRKYRLTNKEKIKEHIRKYRLTNKEKIKEQRKQYYLENIEKNKERARLYYYKNKERMREYEKRYSLNNKEKRKEINKRYYSNSKERNREKKKEYNKRYNLINKEIIKERRKKRHQENRLVYNEKRKEKYKKDIAFRTIRVLRSRINSAIKQQNITKTSKTKDLIGCDWNTLKSHFELKFKEGMTWENHGRKGWHVDHIIPCASFDFTDPEQQKKCFHYTNLQPLWWYENFSKRDKILEEYTKDIV